MRRHHSGEEFDHRGVEFIVAVARHHVPGVGDVDEAGRQIDLDGNLMERLNGMDEGQRTQATADTRDHL